MGTGDVVVTGSWWVETIPDPRFVVLPTDRRVGRLFVYDTAGWWVIASIVAMGMALGVFVGVGSGALLAGGLVLMVVAHEAGHLLAAVAFGKRIDAVGVRHGVPLVGWAAPSGFNSPGSLAIIALAGPATDLALGIWWASVAVHRSIGGAAGWMVIELAALQLISCVGNLVVRQRGQPSDGALVARAWRQAHVESSAAGERSADGDA